MIDPDLNHKDAGDMKSLPSDRIFGIFFSAVSTCAGLYAWLIYSASIIWSIFLLLGVLLLVAAFATPKVLAPLNRAWFLLGEILGRTISPLVMLAIFFFLLTPIGVLTRLFGRDELHLRRQEGGSFWVEREQTEAAPDFFNNQY